MYTNEIYTIRHLYWYKINLIIIGKEWVVNGFIFNRIGMSDASKKNKAINELS